MLEVQNLSKAYSAREDVSDISFIAELGQIIGLLGPNGAGKTTTVSMICGLTAADKGSVLLCGEHIDSDSSAVKRRTGLVPQDIALYEDLPAIGNLETFGALYGLKGALLVLDLHQLLLASLCWRSLTPLHDLDCMLPRNISAGIRSACEARRQLHGRTIRLILASGAPKYPPLATKTKAAPHRMRNALESEHETTGSPTGSQPGQRLRHTLAA